MVVIIAILLIVVIIAILLIVVIIAILLIVVSKGAHRRQEAGLGGLREARGPLTYIYTYIYTHM